MHLEYPKSQPLSLSLWALMTAINITDSNGTVGLDTYYLFIQYCRMLPFAKARPLIVPSRFSIINTSDSIDGLRSWLVILFASIGLKHVPSCIFLTFANVASHPLSPNFFIPFVKLYVWANIWPNTVDSSVV